MNTTSFRFVAELKKLIWSRHEKNLYPKLLGSFYYYKSSLKKKKKANQKQTTPTLRTGLSISILLTVLPPIPEASKESLVVLFLQQYNILGSKASILLLKLINLCTHTVTSWGNRSLCLHTSWYHTVRLTLSFSVLTPIFKQ